MRKYLVEFIGTFFLVLTVVLTVNGTAGIMAPVAIGAMLMVMIYAGGHISGAHFNPAVTLGVLIRGKVAMSDVPGYLIAQIVGGILAAMLGSHLIGSIEGAVGISTGGVFDFMDGVIAEFLGTFALVWVILHSATAKGTEGNSFYGLAIGFTITACAYSLGGVTGGAFNPAVAIGVSFAEMTDWGNIATFLTGQLLAGALAAIVFKYVNGSD
jgi:aquaporin Z